MQQAAVKKYPALFLEGGDSVGKNDLLRSIAKYLLVSDPNRKILLMNFPQFWFFGHDIRLVIRGACDDLLSKLSGVENAFVRACLYGMDRDIALLLAEPYLQRDSNLFVLSDRGPFSSCVTTGYLWANSVLTDEQVGTDIVPNMFYTADEGMFSFFDVNSLLCTVEGKFSLGTRKALDNFEAELPQQFSYDVYHMMELPDIITKDGNGWRSRAALVKESLEKSGYGNLYTRDIDPDLLQDDSIIMNAYHEGRVVVIGPHTLIEQFDAHKLFNTDFTKLIDYWVEVSLSGDTISQGKDRKELLDEIETKIALTLKQKTSGFNYQQSVLAPQAKEAMGKLLQAYPIILEILSRTSGDAMRIFLERLLSGGQLTML